MLPFPDQLTTRNLQSLQNQIQYAHPCIPIPPINEHTWELLQAEIPDTIPLLEQAQKGVDDYKTIPEFKTKFKFTLGKKQTGEFSETKSQIQQTKARLEKIIKQVQAKIKTQSILAQNMKQTAHTFQVLTEAEKVAQIKLSLGQFSEACRQKERAIEEDNDDETILEPFLHWHLEYCEAVLNVISYRQYIADTYENACKTTSKRDQKLSKLRSKEQDIEGIAFAASDLVDAQEREAGIKQELANLSSAFHKKGIPSFQRIVEAEWKRIHHRLIRGHRALSEPDELAEMTFPIEGRIGGLVI